MTRLPLLQNVGRHVRRHIRLWISRCDNDCDFNVETMRGACAIASVALCQVIDKVYGLSTTFVTVETWDEYDYCNCHCWVEVKIAGVDYVIDLTATQFNKKNPLVLIVPVEDYFLYKEVQQCKNTSSIFKGDDGLDRLWDWRRPQCPFDYQDKIDAMVKNLLRNPVKID